jgi:hypothetical protein
MSLDILLLLLRITIALALYAFLGMLFVFLWRDVRAVGQQVTSDQTPLGHLLIISCEDDLPLEVGQEYPLRPYTTIGRGPTNTVVLPDTYASMEHAQIILRGGQWWLDDRQSRNGTTLNDLPVTEPVVLSADDIIGIGRVKMKITLAP